jgi:hypothetical protein
MSLTTAELALLIAFYAGVVVPAFGLVLLFWQGRYRRKLDKWEWDHREDSSSLSESARLESDERYPDSRSPKAPPSRRNRSRR